MLSLHNDKGKSEQSVILTTGIMYTGLAEESTGLQNITGMIYPGQSFVAPQGMTLT